MTRPVGRYRKAGDIMWRVRMEWEPRQILLGLRWTQWSNPWAGGRFRSRTWSIFLVPCLPLIVSKRETLRDIEVQS